MAVVRSQSSRLLDQRPRFSPGAWPGTGSKSLPSELSNNLHYVPEKHTAASEKRGVSKLQSPSFNLITEVGPQTTFANFSHWEQTDKVQSTFKGRVDYQVDTKKQRPLGAVGEVLDPKPNGFPSGGTVLYPHHPCV